MDMQEKLIEYVKRIRSKLFEPIAKKVVKIGISANLITSLSFLSGLTAVYFLFVNHWLFVTFIILHLLLDGFDGVVARITTQTRFGDYFDHISDQIVGVLLLVRIYFYLQDYYVLIVTMLSLMVYSVYFISKKKYPCWFSRTTIAIMLLFLPLSYDLIPTLTYLTAGVLAAYSLIRQIDYFVRTWFS